MRMVRHLERNPAAVSTDDEMVPLAEALDISRAEPNTSLATKIHNWEVNPVVATASRFCNPQQWETGALKVTTAANGSDDGKMQIDERRDPSKVSQIESKRRFVYYNL
jgi:hypothetical protein